MQPSYYVSRYEEPLKLDDIKNYNLQNGGFKIKKSVMIATFHDRLTSCILKLHDGLKILMFENKRMDLKKLAAS